jgi:CRISPR system Cascade subunit CasC
MLIEIHMIQNHSPANLNRDDLGAPKTCVFGGVTRARISSQCLKRSIRRSAQFQTVLEKEGGKRTRRLITQLAETASGPADPPQELTDLIAKAFEKGGVKRDPTAEDANATNILMFVPKSAIDNMAAAAKDAWEKKKRDPDGLAERLAGILGHFAAVPDIALCGRMTELDRAGLFARLNLHGEAALSAAHAISTHAVVNEVDYFTAVDDLGKGTGAGHVNEAMYNSACFYKYFCLDWDQLVSNLTSPDADTTAKKNAARLAAATLGHFIRAAAQSTPSGKQNSFASNCEPCGILVEIKKEAKTPTSYANAFADPVERIGKPDDDAPDEKSIEGRSVACLADHVQSVRKAYGIDSKLFWYSPKLWRFPLQYWERASAVSSNLVS